MPLGYHICFRPRDDRVVTPSDAARRELARAVHRIAGPHGLLAFRAADTHCHLEALHDGIEAGELVRRVEMSLTKRLGIDCGLRQSAIRPIERQQHLLNTLLYVLRQHERHGLQSDPYHEASSLPDLLGARLLGAYLIERVREYLPRVTRRQLLEIAGVAPSRRLALDPQYLPRAAAAALALPSLTGRVPDAVMGRAVVVQLASPSLSTREIAALLETSTRSVRRLRHLETPPGAKRVVERQALLRQAVDRAKQARQNEERAQGQTADATGATQSL